MAGARRDIQIQKIKCQNSFAELALGNVRNNGIHKRRFTDEQIKFLEVMFESESRPESRLKHQLASELGLQPRQVAIWFQNRRARLKSKQVEREYNILKASYDALASSLASLKTENQSLLNQLQALKNQHAAHNGSGSWSVGETGSGTDSESHDQSPAANQSEGCACKQDMPVNDQYNRNTVVSPKEEIDILNLSTEGPYNGSIASSDWHNFDPNCFVDESSGISQWWECLS